MFVVDWNAGLGADWRFLFLYVRIAVSETSMLVLLVVGGDDEGTGLGSRGEMANTVSYQSMDATMLVPAICRVLGGGGRGKEERNRFDSIRVGWSERRCDAGLFIAGRRKKAAPQPIYWDCWLADNTQQVEHR